MKNYKDITLNSLPERELEIIGVITAEKMSVAREKALKKLKESVEIDGFRKGNAPETIIAQKVGEMRILEEATEIALGEEYPNILEEHNIDAIGRPEITITKMGLGADMEFKAKTSLMPEVKLSAYKKIVKSVESSVFNTLATDAEVEAVVQDIQKHSKETEITDDLKNKIRENITIEKEIKEKDKRRTEILEKIIDGSTIELPKIIIEGEQEKMLAQFKDDIGKSGISFEEYLKHIKKTEEDLKKEWRDTAVKRAKSQVILNTIAKEEGITPKEEDVKKEIEHITAHYKETDRFRVRMYVETFLTNELVFQFLEKQ